MRISETHANSAPRVSVAMCTYNGASHLPEQLESFVSQTCLPHEIVICDDRSSDATHDMLLEFVRNAPFPVRFSANAGNLGVGRNFGEAIEACRGDIIFLADQDDIWFPRKIERMMDLFRTDSVVGLCFSDALIVDDRSEPVGHTLWEALRFGADEQNRMDDSDAFGLLANRNVIAGATMAFRARYRRAVLPIPTEAGWIHDGWIALIVAAIGRLRCVREPLMAYRRHVSQSIGVRSPRIARLGVDGLMLTREERRGRYLAGLRRDRAVRERLLQLDVEFGSRDREVALIDDKLVHLHARSRIARTHRWRRVPVIASELTSGRYGRYARGFSSAAKDFLL